MRGTVIKRDKTWSVVVDLGRDAAGQRVRRWHSGYRTRKEAERARVELLGRLDQGTYVAPTRLTLGRFLTDEWLPAKRSTVKETTLASYELHVSKHLVPALGGLALVAATAPRLNAFYADKPSWAPGAGTAAVGWPRRPSETSTARCTRPWRMRPAGACSPATRRLTPIRRRRRRRR